MKLVSLILTLAFVGCSSIRIDSTNPSLQTPILTKSGQRGINLEVGSSDRIKFTEDASARPPTINPVESRSNDLRAHFSYGLNESFDIAAGFTSSLGIDATSRFHLTGDDTSTWITAGTLFFNYNSTSKSGDQNGEFGPGGYNWDADATSFVYSLGLSAGYRYSEDLLLIVNAGFGKAEAKLTIKQDPGNSDPGGKYTYESEAPMHNLGLGVTFGRRNLTTLGVMYTHKAWNDSTLSDTSTTHAILKIETD